MEDDKQSVQEFKNPYNKDSSLTSKPLLNSCSRDIFGEGK